MINKNMYYLCHFCLDFISNYKNDISKHVNKMNKCKPYSLFNDFEEAKNHSFSKKYIFYFDKTKLSKNDILFIISNYHNHINHIFEDFRNPEMIYKNNSNFYKNKSETKEPNFICNSCETTFTTKYNLIKHMKNIEICKSKKTYNMIMKHNEEVRKQKLCELEES